MELAFLEIDLDRSRRLQQILHKARPIIITAWILEPKAQRA